MFKGLLTKLIWLSKKSKLKKCGMNTIVGRHASFISPQRITIGNNFNAGKNLKLQVWVRYRGKEISKDAYISIGDNVSIRGNCHLSAAHGITINNGVLLGDNVFITDNFHGAGTRKEMDLPPLERDLHVKGPVLIDDNVWIGRNVCVMPAVKIGRGAVIGANSVVTHNIPPFSIAVGAPARVIKRLDDGEKT